MYLVLKARDSQIVNIQATMYHYLDTGTSWENRGWYSKAFKYAKTATLFFKSSSWGTLASFVPPLGTCLSRVLFFYLVHGTGCS